MPRKSKNKRGANAMFGLTKKEQNYGANGYGTTTLRYGSDAQTKFGWCALGLQPARTPVCSPQGVIFDRQAIIEYLLGKKMELRQQQEEYDLQQESERIRAETEELTTQDELKISFLQKNGNDIGSRATAQVTRVISAEDRVRQDKEDMETLSEKTAHIKSSNFWLPQAIRKEVVETKLKAPETCPRCPISGKALKSKQLVSLQFTRDNSVQYGEPGNIVCCVSQKAIQYQKASVLKSCGHVMLSSFVKELVTPSMKCPACNKTVKKVKDIVELKQGGTSYSGGGEAVESKKYKTGVR